MKTVLCCEDSLEGILCGVYEGWAGKYGHASVALALGNPGQQELFVRYVQVPTETEPAQKVYRTVLRVMGEEACEQMAKIITRLLRKNRVSGQDAETILRRTADLYKGE